MLTAIDHLVIVVPELDAAISSYRGLGFTVTPGGRHPIGTHNALIGLADGSKDEGRDPERFPNMLYHNININADRQSGLEESKRFLDRYYGPVFTPAMVEAWTVAGDPERCVDDLRRIIDQGVRAITLRITGWQQREQYQRLVGEVLSKL